MVEAMLQGLGRAAGRPGGCARTRMARRERLVRQFAEFADEYPWQWTPAHVDEWSLSLTGERHDTLERALQCDLRLFTEFVTDNARYGWASACMRSSGRGSIRCRLCTEWTRSRT